MPRCLESASWFGYGYDSPGESSISTTLHGNGKAVLEFGNCYTQGNVIASINDKEILSVGPGTYNVTFDFQDGDKLKISESGDDGDSCGAVIQFNDLRFISCSSSGKK